MVNVGEFLGLPSGEGWDPMAFASSPKPRIFTTPSEGDLDVGRLQIPVDYVLRAKL
jgi:hypothetical protein